MASKSLALMRGSLSRFCLRQVLPAGNQTLKSMQALGFKQCDETDDVGTHIIQRDHMSTP